MTDRPPNHWQKSRNTALALGAAAAVGAALLALRDLDSFFRGYLFAYLCICFPTAGFLGLLALGNLTGGRWSVVSRPILAAGTDTTLLVAILFVPVALGLEHIYVWATTEGQQMFEGTKAAWLSPGFFLARAVAYLVIWLLVAVVIVRSSPFHRAPGETTGMRRAGAGGLVVLIAVVTMAAFDWGMSLEPEWYSSIYGAILAISGVVAAHAFVALSLCRLDVDAIAPLAALSSSPQLDGATAEPEAAARIRGDVGNLLLAFVMLWAYFSVSQLLIIWAGNLPSEIEWYLPRIETSWQWLAIALVVLHFAAPFLLLISRQVKRSTRALRGVAILLLVMYTLNMFWVIKPAFAPEGFYVSISDVVCLLALGGLWTAAFFWRLERRWAGVIRRSKSTERGA